MSFIPTCVNYAIPVGGPLWVCIIGSAVGNALGRLGSNVHHIYLWIATTVGHKGQTLPVWRPRWGDIYPRTVGEPCLYPSLKIYNIYVWVPVLTQGNGKAVVVRMPCRSYI